MLFGNDRTASSEGTFNSFAFSLRQKARTPIRQSINFSSESMTKMAVRRVMKESSTRSAYTIHGAVTTRPVGHLLNATA